MEKYDDEFKLEVVNAYMESTNGVRVIARSYGLPSKNYIERWIKELKEKGLLPQDEYKTNGKSSMKKSAEKAGDPYEGNKKTPREAQLEKEVLRLRAELDFLKKLKELGRRDAQGR